MTVNLPFPRDAQRDVSKLALNHRPISQDIPAFIVLSSPTRHQPGRSTLTQARNQHPLLLIGLSMLLTFLLLWAIGSITTWGSVQLDTLRYGYPRTVQLDHAVGHGGISHFTAWNLQGQVYVMELPAGNPAASHLLVGPRLIGAGADLAPIQLTFTGDPHRPDLLSEVQGVVMRFSHTGSTYIPAVTSS